MPKATRSPIESEAITLVQNEYNQWRDATAFVTTRIAFNIRVLIETLRKNYYGIFDEPNDPMTGQKKIFIPLTESLVDSIVKNIDLDTKDINLSARRPNAIGLLSFVRSLVKTRLEDMSFGDLLDEMERFLAVDGTVVWKTYLTNENGKPEICVKRVDLLNFFIDPTAPSVQEATVIERAALTVNEVQSMDGWINTEDLVGSNVSRNDVQLNGLNTTTTTANPNLVEVWERWGLMPRYLLTGNKKDTDMVEGHIVVSGTNGAVSRVHLIEENTEKDSDGCVIKPYEECWYMKAMNRWHGRGPAEKVMMLQIYLNTIMNIRINRAKVNQLGLFKIKKNAGITPQMISQLPVSGAIVVNDPGDIEQMVIQEASQASYQDEQVISSWAGRVTSAFESVTGEQLPSSTPATNAVIQNRMAQSQFVMVRKGIGLFLQRWLRRHYLPKLGKTVTKGEVIRMTGDVEDMKNFDTLLANGLMKQKVDELKSQGKLPTPGQVLKERDRVKGQLSAHGYDRFLEIIKKPDFGDYDVNIDITNEEIDKGVLVQNLMQALTIAGQIPDTGIDVSDVLRQIFDLAGLNSDTIKKTGATSMPPQQPQAAPQQPPQMTQPPTQQRSFTSANTL